MASSSSSSSGSSSGSGRGSWAEQLLAGPVLTPAHAAAAEPAPPAPPAAAEIRHWCNGCGRGLVASATFYRCQVCPDFDLCDLCHTNGYHSDNAHLFTMVVDEFAAAEPDLITLEDYMYHEEEVQEQVLSVLGDGDSSACTWGQGQSRQSVYACKTCFEATGRRAGICMACSLKCHQGHEILELYTKRNFSCDCGTDLFPAGAACCLAPNKPRQSLGRNTSHNFEGRYCVCDRPYPDPDLCVHGLDETMVQCTVCEDWFHTERTDGQHRRVVQPPSYDCFVCEACMGKHPFLWDYHAKPPGFRPLSSGCHRPAQIPDMPERQSAAFFLGLRENLCCCPQCEALYKEHDVGFLTDATDSINAYLARGRTRQAGLEAEAERVAASKVADLGHVGQIELALGMRDFSSSLKEFLEPFARDGKVVTREDVSSFTSEMRKRRRTDQFGT